MFDIRALRENPEAFRLAWNRRKPGLGDVVDDIHAHDAALRKAVTDKQDAEKVRNEMSKLIGRAKAEKNEEEAARLMALVAEAKDTIEAAGEQEAAAKALLDDLLMGLPNLPLSDVPDGPDEHANVEQHKWEPEERHRAVNNPKDHADLGEALKSGLGFPQMDFDSAVKMSGARFVALRGKLARMERALAAFMLDLQTGEHGYEEVSPPLLVRDEALVGTGQLPKFAEDLFSGFFGLEDVEDYADIKVRTFQFICSVLESIRNVEGEISDETVQQAMKRTQAADYVPKSKRSDSNYTASFERVAQVRLRAFERADINWTLGKWYEATERLLEQDVSIRDEISR
ncbi:MAG: hypothetical protein V7741_10135, partial [Hyphomonas sp.]